MFEFAASYPTEAEESLKVSKSRYKSLLGIIGSHRAEAKPLIAQMGIKAEAIGNGYEYEITVPTELKELAKEKAIALLSKFDCDLQFFEYLVSTDFARTYDQEGEIAYSFPSDTADHEILSSSLSTDSGMLMSRDLYGEQAKAFDCFLRVHRFL
jgi:hypothetical protein